MALFDISLNNIDLPCMKMSSKPYVCTYHMHVCTYISMYLPFACTYCNYYYNASYDAISETDISSICPLGNLMALFVTS